jgi:holin-like protein
LLHKNTNKEGTGKIKYLKQFAIIMLITMIGEIIRYILPWPIPASIYGMLLMLFLLCTGIIKLEHVRDAGMFLVDIMPVLFIPSAAGIIARWDKMGEMLPAILITLAVVLPLVMFATGHTTQLLLRLTAYVRKRGHE